jgi:DNA-binding HxlR family transcriptional regulator
MAAADLGVSRNPSLPPASSLASANKWSVPVLARPMDGARRYSELRRSLDGALHKMLTATPRGLERGGFIARSIYPPQVQYPLTDLAELMIKRLRILAQFASANRNRRNAARVQFDRNHATRRRRASSFASVAGPKSDGRGGSGREDRRIHQQRGCGFASRRCVGFAGVPSCAPPAAIHIPDHGAVRHQLPARRLVAIRS